jgi:tRNA-dihydrouridine synthase B
MAALTTPSMRTLCEEMGCPLTFTDMVPVDGLVRGPGRLRYMLRPSFYVERPYGVQLLGKRPGDMEEAARMAADAGASLIDLNMGCPARKVVKTGGGVALMRDQRLAASLVEAARRGVGDRLPVTVKIRTGWDESSLNAPELARVLEQAGAAWVVVHGRHRRQLCAGPVDLDTIAAVVDAVDVPVFGNGGVVDDASMETMVRQTGCAGVMVAQGALGRPWLFRQLAAAWRREVVCGEPSLEERRELMIRHLDLYLREADERRAVREMRKHLGWYAKGTSYSASFRHRLFQLTDPEAIRAHIATLGKGPAVRSGQQPGDQAHDCPVAAAEQQRPQRSHRHGNGRCVDDVE